MTYHITNDARVPARKLTLKERVERAKNDPVLDQQASAKPFEQSELLATQRDRIREDNDMIVCISPSSKTEGSGTGKTTMGIRACRWFDMKDSAWDAEKQASLDSTVVAEKLYPDLPAGSAILFDEAQGTLDSDGVDARRAMSDAVVRMARSAAQHRTKHHTLVMVTQSTQWLDSRMMDIIDRLVLIQERDFEREWARAVTFDYYYDDLGSSKNEYTPSIEDIYWRPLSTDDPDYQHIEKLKLDHDEEQDINDDEADDEPEFVQQRVDVANELYHERGFEQSEIADILDRTQSWVSQVT